MADIKPMDTSNDNQWWEPGKLALVFFSMGQGDCCVIICPDGRHVMIDCGSKAFEAEGFGQVRELLLSSDVLGAPDATINTIDALVLTHSDQDHYNQIPTLLEGLTVKRVYFSEPDFATNVPEHSKSSPLKSYSISGTSNAIYNDLKVEELHCVTTLAAAKQLKVDTWTPPFKIKNHAVNPCERDNSSDVLLKIVDDPNNQFSVSILAGNVPKGEGDLSADANNAASLVTFIEMGDKKILVCGDATSSTENYLLKYHSDKLKELTLLQVPHHGSYTSSTIEFIIHTQPKEIIVSVRKDETSYHLPRAVAIRPYYDGGFVAKDESSRLIGYWAVVERQEIKRIRQSWDTEGFSYTIERDGQHREKLCVAKTPDNNGVKILDGFNKPASEDGFVLYEVSTKYKVFQTGTQGHCWFLYP